MPTSQGTIAPHCFGGCVYYGGSPALMLHPATESEDITMLHDSSSAEYFKLHPGTKESLLYAIEHLNEASLTKNDEWRIRPCRIKEPPTSSFRRQRLQLLETTRTRPTLLYCSLVVTLQQ